ncbi:hypothetical protein GCM10009662_60610 [Catellatospora coxensis]|uniref:DUF2637 domain-containing protein n=2 Tax=Catellatospora coxensis TaxID=310354 RepID=A0A8J3KVX4_9ACTN|nr:hypothetical protein Cco03nite_47600 [Catellatospora coxensis]
MTLQQPVPLSRGRDPAEAPSPAGQDTRTARTVVGHRTEDRVQILIMLAIGLAAAAASFTHVHDVAEEHGQPGWLAWADAVILELMSVASGLELRRRKRLGLGVFFPASVLVVAVLLSLAAQVVEAERSVIGWLAAMLPAVGFLAMVKIAMGRADGTPPGSGPGQEPGGVADRSGTSPAGPDIDPEVAALLPAALAAAHELTATGEAVSRASVARRLRAQGHALSNATANDLMRHVRGTTPKGAAAPSNPEAVVS